MILLALFDAFYTIIAGGISVVSAVLPPIPTEFSSALNYILQAINNGLSVLFYIFLDPDVVGPLLTWVLAAWMVLFTLDTAWMIIGYIKLSRKN